MLLAIAFILPTSSLNYDPRSFCERVRTLVCVGEAQNGRLAPVAAHELEADGQSRRREAAGDAYAGHAREVRHACVDVRQIHRERVVGLLAEAERGRRRGRRQDGVTLLKGFEEVALYERASLLRLEVVGVVVAGRQDVCAEH